MGRKPDLEITDKQRQLLRLIVRETERNGCQPSREELAVLLGTSKPAVTQKIQQLCKKGYLAMPSKKRERCMIIPGVVFRAESTDGAGERIIQEILRS
jgi:DNA-binding MarR family transcriptional regulator